MSLWEYLKALILCHCFHISLRINSVFCGWKGLGQGVRPRDAAVATPGDPGSFGYLGRILCKSRSCVLWHSLQELGGYQTCSSDVSRGLLHGFLRANRIFAGRAL